MDGGQATTIFSHLFAQQQLAGNQAGLDRFPKADVIRDEEVDPRQQQRLAQWFELVGIQANTGTEGGLEQPGVRSRDTVPAQRMQVGGKPRGRVKAPGGNRLPGLPCQDGGIEFPLPEHVERLPLVVIVNA